MSQRRWRQEGHDLSMGRTNIRLPRIVADISFQKTSHLTSKYMMEKGLKPGQTNSARGMFLHSVKPGNAVGNITAGDSLNRRTVKDLLGLRTVHEINEAEELLADDPEALVQLVEDRRRSIANCNSWLQNHVRPLSPISGTDTRRLTIKVVRAPPSVPQDAQTGTGHSLLRKNTFPVLPSVRSRFNSAGRATTKGQAQEIRDYDPDLEEEAEMLNAPQTPRFCATLSPEAQFAMMQGYEDLLRTRIVRSSVVTASRESSAVAKSPRNGPSRLPTPRGHRVQLSNTRAESKDADSAETDKRQLGLTKTFQNAMDILDCLKGSEGENVTSPRNLKRFHNPVNKYKKWTKDWSEEFKITRPTKV